MAEGSTQHQHFIYDLRYNLTSRREKGIEVKKCAKIKDSERLFTGISHCIYVDRYTGIRKQASQKRFLEVPFSTILPMEPQKLMECRDIIFERKNIERALSRTVFSGIDITEMMLNLRINLSSLLTSSTCRPADVELALMKESEQIKSKSLLVDNEIPHTKWLKQYVQNILGAQYVIKSREDNVKYIGMESLEPTEVTDYAASQSDLVIFKNELGTNPRGCNIIIHEHRSGLAAELKEEEDGEFAISECFRNMHGTAANLVLQATRQGIIIDCVTIYGIVGIVKEIDQAKLLELHIDFTINMTNFFKSVGLYSLDLLLNAIVKQL